MFCGFCLFFGGLFCDRFVVLGNFCLMFCTLCAVLVFLLSFEGLMSSATSVSVSRARQ